MDKKTIILIILNVIFISVFIGIFFFTYASKVEGEIVKTQVEFLVKDFTQDTLTLLPKDILQEISAKLKNTELPDMKDIDAIVAQKNKDLVKKAYTALGLLLIAGIIICIFIYRSSNLNINDIKSIIFEVFVMLCCVALTEYVFLNYIAKNYYSIETNTIKREIINLLNDI